MRKQLNVLYQSSNLYSLVTGVSITSLLENNKDIEVIKIHILNDGINNENVEKFLKICQIYNREIVFIDIEPINQMLEKANLPKWKGRYTPYYKLFAFDKLDIEMNQILVLDSDTIINESISEILDYDLSDFLAYATFDCLINNYKKRIGMLSNEYYYNTGVLYLNLQEWRENNCTNKVLDHILRIRSAYVIADQDIMNVLFRNEFKVLDLRYNFNPAFFIYGVKSTFTVYKLKSDYYFSFAQVEEAKSSIKIYHCMGAMTGRPWELNNFHPQNDLFDKYKEISPWKSVSKFNVRIPILYRIQNLAFRILPKSIYTILHRCLLIVDFDKRNKELLINNKDF